jgi:SAM-dependent methyltransferase
MAGVSLDPRAATGFAAAAEAYERGRPGYPEDAVAALLRVFGVGSDGTVLDLAAGTGKLTRLLPPHVARVVAVDASDGMLAVLHGLLPGVEARAGTADAIPLADASVDAVFVAEAFHWFGTPPVCREIARVLVPGGGLALLSNRERWSEDDLGWLPAFQALTRPHRDAAGAFPAEGDAWQRAIRDTGLFEPLERADARHVHHTTGAGVVDLVASWSWIANLPASRRAALLDAIRDLIGADTPLALPYETEIHWTRRLGSAAA